MKGKIFKAKPVTVGQFGIGGGSAELNCTWAVFRSYRYGV